MVFHDVFPDDIKARVSMFMEGMGYTENGALTYNSSGSSLVDMFFKFGAIRDLSKEDLFSLFHRAYKEHSEISTRIALWGRDPRQGAGERRVFREYLLFLYDISDIDTLARVVRKVPEIGRWDDMFVIPDITIWGPVVKEGIDKGDRLLFKWLPREKSSKRELANRIRRYLGLSRRAYRKLLASNTDVVEQNMSSGKWDEIKYEQVPSIASIRYSNAFTRHDEVRYREFLRKVRDGKSKMNMRVAYPHQIIKMLRLGKMDSRVLDTMWREMSRNIEYGNNGFILPMVDVSGSMMSTIDRSGTTCLDVAIGLGMFIADNQKVEAFRGKILTFSANPTFVVYHPGDSLRSKFNTISRADWGANTNLYRAFRAILNAALRHRLGQKDMPSMLLVISDMEFDAATRGRTNFDAARSLFRRYGYDLPTVVFWNVQSRHKGNIPVRMDERGVVLISGYNPVILEGILEVDLKKIAPGYIMLKTVLDNRYDF